MSCTTAPATGASPESGEGVMGRARDKYREQKERLGEARAEAELELATWRVERDVVEDHARRRARSELAKRRSGRVILNGPQAVVQAAIGIMALLMIGVVVLGKIDTFTPTLSGTWQNTSNNVSEQSGQTFDFLNLVPFIIVALFVLGLMASRM